MNLNLLAKCTLAFISGIACDLVGAFPWDRDSILSAFGFFGLSGFLFALGVLLPYLRRDRWMLWRGAALVAVSTVSYRSASFVVRTLSCSSCVPTAVDIIAASFVGALIVLLGAKLLIPLHHPVQLAVSGFVAAVLGGLVFSASLSWRGGEYVVLAFGAWHLLIAAAIHLSELRDWKAQKAI